MFYHKCIVIGTLSITRLRSMQNQPGRDILKSFSNPAPQTPHLSREDSLTINLCSIFSLRTSTLPVVTNSWSFSAAR